MRWWLLALCVASYVVPLAAQEKVYPVFECRWATGPIEIDGKADDPAWGSAELIDNFSRPWLEADA